MLSNTCGVVARISGMTWGFAQLQLLVFILDLILVYLKTQNRFLLEFCLLPKPIILSEVTKTHH